MASWLARSGILFLGLGPMAVGCSTRDPIDRTQPNEVAKSFFVGNDLQATEDDPEFHMKGYVVDNSASQTQFAVGEFTSLERIRWEITEKMLFAHRSYQEAEGADGRALRSEDGSRPIGPANGTIVAAYAILSHFDVRNSYNPSTGEEENVLEENAIDRPWNERKSMRVDWSRNLVDSTADTARFFGWAKVTPVEYAVTDPTSDDAMHIDSAQGYMDVTNKFTLLPDNVQFPWGKMPACVMVSFLTGSATYDCNPQESTMRFSFLRIDPNHDFERFEDTTAWRDVVGNWGGSGDGFNAWLGAPQTKWDPQYGYVDANTKRFKTIHDIWTHSHQDATCTSNDDEDRSGTADQCENGTTGYAGNSGSQCDVYAGRCTIPVRDREIKTIGYWLNKDVPNELLDELDANGEVIRRGTLEDLPYSWNQLLSVSVAYRREVECRRTGDGDRDTCHATFFESDASPSGKTMVSFGGWLTDTPKAQEVDKGKPVFTLCHNPVRAYDQPTCGPVGSVSRLGDLRHNHLIYWPHETRAPFGGVGGNPPDPLTGESIGVTATVIGRSATMAAAMQRDVIQVLLGDLKMDDLIAGVPGQIYADSLKNGGTGAQTMKHSVAAGEQTARLASIDSNAIRNRAGISPLAGEDTLGRGLAASQLRAQTSTHGPGWVGAFGQYEALAGKLRGTEIEAKIADSSFMSSVLGAAPGSTVTPDMMDLASPLRGLDPTRLDAMNQWLGEYLSAKGACFHEGMMAGLGNIYQPSLVEYYRAKYGDLDAKTRGERIYLDLWRDATKGIGLHEIGHSLGLRHNFASSWDAPNYDPQYWQLRTAEGTATGVCQGPRDGDDDTCMGPRYVDPITPDEAGLAGESRPALDYFANSSTMEYQLDRFGETVGLGTYDQHAMKALYGRVLETFDASQVSAGDQRDIAPKHYTQLQEKDLVIDGNQIFSHYTSTARRMKVFDPARDCREATDDERATAEFRIVHGKVCAPAPKDHWAWEDFKSDDIPRVGIRGVKWHAELDGKADTVRWPYRYGEQYGSGGYMHTSLFDAGADIYELVQNHTKTFDLAYPFQYFRRGRREWSTLSLPQATSTRFFSRLRSYHWQVALDLSRSSAAELANDNNGKPYAMAQRALFEGLTRAALMPEPGDYAQSAARTTIGSLAPIFDVAAAGGNATSTNFTLGLGTARFIGDDFDNDLGGSWDYQKYLNHAGFEMEKAYAVMQLVDSRPTLFTVQRENYLDDRGVYISFRSDMQEATDRFLGAVLSEDWETVAPEGSGKGEIGLTYPDLVAAAPRSAEARIVFPNVGYKQQLGFASYAAIFSRLSSDMSLVHKLRIWFDGDAVPTVNGTRQVRFTDPQSGYTYVANAYGTEAVLGKQVDRGIASRMIEHANALLVDTYELDTSETPTEPGDGGAPVASGPEQPRLKLDASGRPILRDPAKGDLALRRYIGLLDALRQIDRTVGGGPLGGAKSEEE